MKHLAFVFVLLLSALAMHGQTKDSIDNILLKIPPQTEVTRQPAFTGLILRNKTENAFCQMAIYKQQPANSDKLASFQKEWNELVLAFYDANATPKPVIKKTKHANALSFATQAVNKANNLPYYVELNVFDLGNNVQSILLTYGAKKHVPLFDSLWQSVIAGVKTNTVTQANADNKMTSPFAGVWAKSSGGTASLGYFKTQYNFMADGTYALHAETWGGQYRSDYYTLNEESGTYVVKGDQLTIIPSKSKWIETDANGKVKKNLQPETAKRSYAWQLYFFEGLNETQLVLTPVKEYQQDGGLGGNSLFPGSYLYSTTYKPEWKIKW